MAQDALRARRTVIAGGLFVLVLATAFLTLGVFVRSNVRPMGWESTLVTVARNSPPPWAHAWLSAFNRNVFAVIVLVLAAVALATRRPVLAIAAVIGCGAAVYSAEHIFKRLLEDGYPSAHVTAAAACATFAWCLARRRRVLALVVFVVPVVVAWAAVAVRMHYPADAIGGFALGLLGVIAVVFSVEAAVAVVRPGWLRIGGADAASTTI